MKKFLLILFAVLFISTDSLFAQRQQTSEDYSYDYHFLIPGKLTYGYVVAEDGRTLKDGNYSINCKLDEKKINNQWISGTYKLNATFVKGNLNGAVTSDHRLTLKDISVGTKNAVITFKGNFKKAIPDGNFVISNDFGIPVKLNVNYSNGKLVGAFSYQGANSTVTGTLNSQSKPTGAWKIKRATSSTDYTFQNGVLISEKTKDRSTPPAMSELAKQYALKSITKEKLMEKGVMVLTKELGLGQIAKDAILDMEDSGVDFNELGGYDFSEENVIVYEYLFKSPTLTQEGVNKLVEIIINYLNGNQQYEDNDGNYVYESSPWDAKTERYGIIGINDDDVAYVITPKRSQKYVSGGDFNQNYRENAILDAKQLARVDAAIEQILINKAVTLKDWVLSKHEDRYYLKQYAESDIDNYGLEYVKSYQEKLTDAYEFLLDVMKKPYTGNENYLLIDTAIWTNSNSNSLVYIKKESVEEFKSFIDERNKRLEELLYDEEQKKQEKLIQPLCDYLKGNPGSGLLSARISTDYFDPTGLDPKKWIDEVKVLLEPLRKIVDCKLLSYNKETGESVFAITKETEDKKGNVIEKITYSVPMIVKMYKKPYDGTSFSQQSSYRIVAKSIDFAKATIIEETPRTEPLADLAKDICVYLRTNPKNGDYTIDYLDLDGMNKETWARDLDAILETFRKIVACEVVSCDETTGEVIFKVTKQVKGKKGAIFETKYQIPMTVKNGKIVVKSIDPSKATIVE